MFPACGVCSRPLAAIEWWHNFFRRVPGVYPVRTVAGEREEREVRWLCERCENRAARLLQEFPGDRAPL